MLHNLERLYKAEFYFWILDVRNIKIKVLEILASGKVNVLIYYNKHTDKDTGHTELGTLIYRQIHIDRLVKARALESHLKVIFELFSKKKNGILPEIMLLLTYQSWLWGLPNIWYHRIVLPHSLFPCQESVTL